MKREKPLKRTPIARGEFKWARKPIERTAGPARRKRVNPRSEKAGKRDTDISPEARLEVRARSRDICERCRKLPATDMSHRVGRGRGGPGDAFNLDHLCRECHAVHAHGELEHPWYVRGRFIKGVYVGPEESYHVHYNGTPGNEERPSRIE